MILPCDALHLTLEASRDYSFPENSAVRQGFQNFTGTDDFNRNLAVSQV